MPSVQKKINELEVGLLHPQQNINISEISLPIHFTVQSVVKKANDGGRKPSAEDLSGSLGDSMFLNALQKDVSRWIREMQKVIKHRIHIHYMLENGYHCQAMGQYRLYMYMYCVYMYVCCYTLALRNANLFFVCVCVCVCLCVCVCMCVYVCVYVCACV